MCLYTFHALNYLTGKYLLTFHLLHVLTNYHFDRTESNPLKVLCWHEIFWSTQTSQGCLLISIQGVLKSSRNYYALQVISNFLANLQHPAPRFNQSILQWQLGHRYGTLHNLFNYLSCRHLSVYTRINSRSQLTAQEKNLSAYTIDFHWFKMGALSLCGNFLFHLWCVLGEFKDWRLIFSLSTWTGFWCWFSTG